MRLLLFSSSSSSSLFVDVVILNRLRRCPSLSLSNNRVSAPCIIFGNLTKLLFSSSAVVVVVTNRRRYRCCRRRRCRCRCRLSIIKSRRHLSEMGEKKAAEIQSGNENGRKVNPEAKNKSTTSMFAPMSTAASRFTPLLTTTSMFTPVPTAASMFTPVITAERERSRQTQTDRNSKPPRTLSYQVFYF